jgi:hypothetical protein
MTSSFPRTSRCWKDKDIDLFPISGISASSGVNLAVTVQSLEALSSNLEADELDVAVLNPIDGICDRFHPHELFTERYLVIFRLGTGWRI